MLIEQAKNKREAITTMLIAEKLPVDDLPKTLDNFLVATEDGKLIGVIGLEKYDDYGLLRSLAVLPDYRNKGVAAQLIGHLEKSTGLKELYLLTETASKYFAGKGFQKITRDEVPEGVKMSSEFSHVCPVSAIVMKKSIVNYL
jgi:amino-acid N-acetyltransferase